MTSPNDKPVGDGGPAFPAGVIRKSRPAHDPGADFHVTNIEEPKYRGLTLRDYFAAKAMAALIGNLPSDDADDEMRTLGYGVGETDRFVAKVAYDYADAMLAVRTQPSQLSDTGRKPE